MKGGWETERERRKGERKLMETAYSMTVHKGTHNASSFMRHGVGY